MAFIKQQPSIAYSSPTLQDCHRAHATRFRISCSTKEPAARAEKISSGVPHSASERTVIEELLKRISKSDGGSALSRTEQSDVNDLIEQLEERGRQQQPRPLENPAIFGNFTVAYSSTERAPTQDRQPAGGRFRTSSIARKIFKTTRLCQSILKPTLVTNKVEFRLFGGIAGSVGLRGHFEAIGDDKATVKVCFEPPVLTLGRSLSITIGPESSVILTTTYLTEAVRLGKGSRGSLFVFTKGGPSDAAEMERVGLEKTSATGWVGILAVLVLLGVAASRLWAGPTMGKVASACPTLFALLLGRATLAGIGTRSKPHMAT